MKVSLFYKSCSKDFDWLKYSRDSVRQFCKGFSEIILCLPEGETFDWPEAKIVNIRETFTPYLFQQAVKLNADTWCSGDFITYQDSDTIFTKPVIPEDLCLNGKPIWITRPYKEARSDQQVWRAPTEKFMGGPVEFEGMYRHPFTLHRDVLKRLRGFCQYRHGVSLDEYIKAQQDPSNPLSLVFSEWNIVAAFAHQHCPEFFSWIDASVDEVQEGFVYQGFTWGGEQRKQEDISKFRELLEDKPVQVCVGVKEQEVRVVSPPAPPSLKECVDLLVDEALKSQYHKTKVLSLLDKAGLRKGGHIKKDLRKGTTPEKQLNDKLLLAIHSYPGGNDALYRHWDHFQKVGADRIVGIGTTDGKTDFPCPQVKIGENKYIEGDHLVRRLIDTIEWCLTQPEDRFMIMEYDTLVLSRPRRLKGICAHLTGGQLPGSKAPTFHHNPWMFDRDSGVKLLAAMKEVAPTCTALPDNSPDVFFGVAVHHGNLKVECPWDQFTRNSLDIPGDLQLAVDAALNNVNIIHGVKEKFQYDAIVQALNGSRNPVSKAA